MRGIGLAVLALALTACSVAPASTPIIVYVTPPPPSTSPGSAPTAAGATDAPSATATVRVVPTRDTTLPVFPTPGPATPAPDASADQGDPIMLTWSSSSDYVTAQVLVPVTNDGNTWILLQEYDSQFTIYDPTGGVLETDSFDAAAPKRLAPGATSYLVGEVFADEHPLSDYATVEADSYFEETEAPADAGGILLPTNIRTRAGSFGGVEVVGEVGNLSLERVDNADVVAIFFNAAGDPIGYARGYVENVEPGGTRAFELSSDFAEIRLGDIATTEVFASAWEF